MLLARACRRAACCVWPFLLLTLNAIGVRPERHPPPKPDLPSLQHQCQRPPDPARDSAWVMKLDKANLRSLDAVTISTVARSTLRGFRVPDEHLTSCTILSSTAVFNAWAWRDSGDTFRISTSCSRAARNCRNLYFATAQRYRRSRIHCSSTCASVQGEQRSCVCMKPGDEKAAHATPVKRLMYTQRSCESSTLAVHGTAHVPTVDHALRQREPQLDVAVRRTVHQRPNIPETSHTAGQSMLVQVLRQWDGASAGEVGCTSNIPRELRSHHSRWLPRILSCTARLSLHLYWEAMPSDV